MNRPSHAVGSRDRSSVCRVGVLVASALLASVIAAVAAPTVHAMPGESDTGPASPEQLSRWRGVSLDGATCGGPPGAFTGERAAYKYFLNPGTADGAGILFMLSGGGVCLKDGPAPDGVSGAAAQLYCMDFSNFQDPAVNDVTFALDAVVARALPLFDRGDPDNPFRTWTFVAVPYCTGDVHAGRMTEAYDYDPTPDGEFLVMHRGQLNFAAVLADVAGRYPGDVPVVLSGISAGGFGAILNFPSVIARYPRTTLLPDVGIAPPAPGSLMMREGTRMADRWLARGVLPPYCAGDDCLGDTLRLLAAHAAAYDGRDGRPWRPFGLLQGQQDGTLSDYLEISRCSYEMGLRLGLASVATDNVRVYVPATDRHGFTMLNPFTGDRPFVSQGGVNALDWFERVATAGTPGDLPASAIDPWMSCNPTFLPLGLPGGFR